MSEWIATYAQAWGCLAIVHPDYIIIRKQEEYSCWDCDLRVVCPGISIHSINRIEARMYVDAAINCIVSMMMLDHRRMRGKEGSSD